MDLDPYEVEDNDIPFPGLVWYDALVLLDDEDDEDIDSIDSIGIDSIGIDSIGIASIGIDSNVVAAGNNVA